MEESLRLGVMAALRLTSHPMHENELSRHIVECAIEVHRTLGGPGLLESVYEEALVWELESRGIEVARQVSLRIHRVVNGL